MYLCFPPACPELFSQLKCVRRTYERTPFCKRASSRLYCKGARCVLSPKHPFKRRTEASACFPKMQPCFGESAQGFAANVYDAFPTLHLPRRRVQKRNAGGSPADALKSDSLPFSAPDSLPKLWYGTLPEIPLGRWIRFEHPAGKEDLF